MLFFRRIVAGVASVIGSNGKDASSLRCELSMEPLERREMLAVDVGAFEPMLEPGSGGRFDSISVRPDNSNWVLIGGDLLGTGLTKDNGSTWRSNHEGWTNYGISEFTWDPHRPWRVWAGTLGGPHVSNDYGQTWTSSNNGMEIKPPWEDENVVAQRHKAPTEEILVDPRSSNQNRLLAFEGDHREIDGGAGTYNAVVWTSNDQGNSWTAIKSLSSGGNIVDAEWADWKVYAAVHNEGVYRSTDYGYNWASQPLNNGLPTNPQILSIAVHPNNNSRLWAAVENEGVYRSNNSGDSWTKVSSGLPEASSGNVRFKSLEIVVSGSGSQAPATLYVSNAGEGNNGGDGLYRSVNNGDNWQGVITSRSDVIVSNATQPGNDAFAAGVRPWWIEIDPSDSNTIWAGDDVRLIRSTDGGATWYDMLNWDTGNGTYKGRGYTGWVANNLEFNPYNSSQIVAQAFDSGKLLYSENGGDTWRREDDGLSTPYHAGNDIAFASATVAFAAFGQGSQTPAVGRTTDGGQTWEELALPSQITRQIDFVHVDTNTPNRVWIANRDGVFYSDNALAVNPGNVDWDPMSGFSGTPVGLESDPFDNDNFYLMTSNGLYRNWGGSGFTAVSLGSGPKPVSDRLVGIDADPSNNGVLYVAVWETDNANNGLWKMESWGWTQLNSSWTNAEKRWVRSVAVDPTDPQRIAVGTHKDPYADDIGATGVWVSENGGQDFEQVNDGLGMLKVKTVTFSPDGQKLYAGTSGNGWYVAPVGDQSSMSQIGEAGQLSRSQSGPGQWHSVSFSQSYTDPVVVMGPASQSDSDPLTVRVRNVTPNGFDFQFDEWNYLDGAHGNEEISWMVIESGTHTLADGRVIEAGTTTVSLTAGGTNDDWQTQSFGAFAGTPVVLTQVSTYNGGDAVVTRLRNVTNSSFDYTLNEQQANNNSAHVTETLGYIVLSTGVNGGSQVATTGDTVTQNNHTINFDNAVGPKPAFFAQMQTTDGGDPAAIRNPALNASSATIFVEEEQSADTELFHTDEDVGWAAFPIGAIEANSPAQASATAPVSTSNGARGYRPPARGSEPQANPIQLPLALATTGDDNAGPPASSGGRLSRPAVRPAMRDQALLLIDQKTLSNDDMDMAFVAYGESEEQPAEDDDSPFLL